MGKAPQLSVSEVQRKRITQPPAPLAEEMQETTGGAALDAAALRSLHGMFLLLDEWDRAMRDGCPESQNSPEECEIVIDTKTP